jgi:Na+-driven multidrug efflux pump
MSLLGLLFAVFATPVMRLMTPDTRVIALGAGCLVAIAAAQPGWAIGDVLSGALRGAGNTTFPMVANVATLWLAVSLAFAGVYWMGGELLWTWWAFTIVTPLGTAAVGWRFRRWTRAERAHALPAVSGALLAGAAD